MSRSLPGVDQQAAINLIIQADQADRYECHVYANPIQALLYVTDHPPGTGGELVVASIRGDLHGPDAIGRLAAWIYPVAGYLVVFDASQHPHYVTPLHETRGHRVVVAMNYFTPAAPESARPLDLKNHLYGN